MYPHLRVFYFLVFTTILIFVRPLYGFEEEINALSLKLATEISANGKTRVAVLDFTNTQGEMTELGRFLAEEVSAALLDSEKRLEVIDRTQIKIILQENKLAQTGLIDQKTAMQLGQIAGVEALITGTVTPFGDTVRVAVKALDANTARLVASARGNIAKTQAIQDLLNTGLATPPGGATSSGKPPASNKGRRPAEVRDLDGFEISFFGCKPSGGETVCLFEILNKRQDRSLQLSGSGAYNGAGVAFISPSRMIGPDGVEYRPAWIEVADVRGDTRITHSFFSGVATRARIGFKGLPEDLSRVPVLLVHFGNRSSMQFKDVPIE